MVVCVCNGDCRLAAEELDIKRLYPPKPESLATGWKLKLAKQPIIFGNKNVHTSEQLLDFILLLTGGGEIPCT